jgi:hypothetical protein
MPKKETNSISDGNTVGDPQRLIFDPRVDTCFVLGAGASMPFGFPSGPGLKEEVYNAFHNDPALRFLHNSSRMSPMMGRVAELLEWHDHGTIDQLLEARREFREIGAILIASAIFRREDPSRILADVNWYRTLYQFLKWQAHGPKTKVSIVTFNYDRSLEFFLDKSVNNWGSSEDTAALNSYLAGIEIVHAHGTLGAYPKIPFAGPRDQNHLESGAENIRIVGDNLSDSQDFVKAQNLVRSAGQIVFLGFGFDERTMERLFALRRGDAKHFACYFIPRDPSLYKRTREDLSRRFAADVEVGPPETDALQFMREVVLSSTRPENNPEKSQPSSIKFSGET